MAWGSIVKVRFLWQLDNPEFIRFDPILQRGEIQFGNFGQAPKMLQDSSDEEKYNVKVVFDALPKSSGLLN